jgi:thiamine-phosphate pyrophosphorylase
VKRLVGRRSRRLLLYYITDRKQLSGEPLLDVVRRAIRRGVDFIQIREKDLTDRNLFELVRRTARLAQGTGTRVLVNGRVDVALAAGAHGVHLPSQSLTPQDVRGCVPGRFLVGVSTHSIGEVSRAAQQGADYVLLGPLFPTPSKLRYGKPLGLDCLRRACRSVSLPVLALGGIGPEQVETTLGAGAAGVAGISLFQRILCARSHSGGERRNKVSKNQATLGRIADQ